MIMKHFIYHIYETFHTLLHETKDSYNLCNSNIAIFSGFLISQGMLGENMERLLITNLWLKLFLVFS